LAKAREFGKLDKDAPVIRLVSPPNFARMFRIFGNAQPSKLEVNLGPQSLNMEAGKFYFMSQHLFIK